ncbi:MAG: response regulator [Nitrososphaera sp.]
MAEDDKDIRTTYDSAFERRGHEVVLTSNGEDCLEVYISDLQHRQQQQRQLGEEEEEKQQLSQEQDLKHYSNRDGKAASVSSSSSSSSPLLSPFDVVILDYRMPKKDGLQVAKEILEINPKQRIIFASAYVKDTLEESVKELKRVVELLQKPFSLSKLLDTVENREAYEGLRMLMTATKDIINDLDNNPSGDQIRALFEGLRRVQKFKGF